jgi:hypothetical protein
MSEKYYSLVYAVILRHRGRIIIAFYYRYRDVLPRCLSPTLAKRHGAILAIAEVVLATAMTVTCDNKLPFPDDIIAEIVSLVQRIDKARLYRGRGGELWAVLVISIAFYYLFGFFFFTYALLAGLRLTSRG